MLTPTAQSSGFTLIELIVTVAIAAILMSIAVPSFQTMMQQNRAASAVNELAGALRLARSEAVTRGSFVSVCPTTTAANTNPTCASDAWASGWLIFADTDNDRTLDGGEQLIRVRETVAAHVTVTPDENITSGLTYEGKGRIVSKGQFQITIGSQQRCVDINPLGQVTVISGVCPSD